MLSLAHVIFSRLPYSNNSFRDCAIPIAESLKKDIYISEAVEILKDLSTQIKADKTVAEVKN